MVERRAGLMISIPVTEDAKNMPKWRVTRRLPAKRTMKVSRVPSRQAPPGRHAEGC